MKGVYYLSCLFMCIFNIGLTSGVSQCYSCSSYECNDPFNSANARIMNCSNMANYRSLTNRNSNNEWEREGDIGFQKFNTLYTPTTDYVCVTYFVKSSYIANNYNFTNRLCMPRYVNNVGACQAATQAVAEQNLGKVEHCQTCDSDLCNSATRWSFPTILSVFLILFGISCF